jgi:hypothetical protein
VLFASKSVKWMTVTAWKMVLISLIPSVTQDDDLALTENNGVAAM